MSAGLVAGGALPRVRGSGAGVGHARSRDPWVDPCIRRKLTTTERLNLRHLTDHLERLDRRLQRAATRHGEQI